MRRTEDERCVCPRPRLVQRPGPAGLQGAPERHLLGDGDVLEQAHAHGSRQRISDGAVHLATEDDRPLSGVTRVDPVVDDGGDEDAGRERSRDAGPDGRPGEHFEGEGSARQLGEGLLGNVRQPRRALLFQRHVDHRQRPEIAEGDQRDAGRRRAETVRGSAGDRSTQLGDTQRC